MTGLDPFPGFPVEPRLPYFHALARIIIYQQLAGAAAQNIHGRVQALSPNPRRFPTAGEILALPEGSLRGAGLSRSKLKAILDLAERVQEGRLKLRGLHRHSDEEVLDRLTAVWGIGEWSAQMFLLFHLGRLDIWWTQAGTEQTHLGRSSASSKGPHVTTDLSVHPQWPVFRIPSLPII
jgi:3-methyladenine DNA glycosylase/8-oxoguanine DNA glycosylase